MGRLNSKEQPFNIELTNGITATYFTVASNQPGESYIIGNCGIAQSLWRALKVPQYEGDYVKVEVNFTNGISMANRLNLSGGRAEWATMNAQIIGIREDYGTHTTSVSIGPAKHLNAQQLSSLLNMWRNRQPWYNPAVRADNSTGSGGNVDLPLATGQSNSTNGIENNGQTQNLDFATPNDPTSTVGGAINNDPNQITKVLATVVAGGKTPTPVAGMTANDIKTMQPRKCLMCDDEGNQFYAMVHVSGGWTEV
jgi:hypothetical protein